MNKKQVKKILGTMFSLGIAVLLCCSCVRFKYRNDVGKIIRLSGEDTTIRVPLKDMKRLDISVGLQVHFVQSDEHIVEIVGDKAIIQNFVITQNRGRVKMFFDSYCKLDKRDSGMLGDHYQITIKYPKLVRTDVSGISYIDYKGEFVVDSLNNIHLSLSGISSMKSLNLVGGNIEIDDSGCSVIKDLKITKANSVYMNISGVSKFFGAIGETSKVSLDVSGTSKGNLQLNDVDKVNTDISGLSHLILSGTVNKMKVEKSGSSTVDTTHLIDKSQK